jgi:2-phospho-L-lactate guanylyltransferase
VDAGILPVKTLSVAKERLATHFDQADRLAIARALLEDALELCARTSWLQWWVVSPDRSVLDAAARRGLRVVQDAGRGLNHALGATMRALAEAGAESTTVVPVDVPLGAPTDVMDLVDTGATSDVVVVPARRDGGTNGLHMRPPGLLATRFGPRSLQAHVNLAAAEGLRCSILSLPRLALDLDTIEDVDEMINRGEGSRTAATLARLRAARRY